MSNSDISPPDSVDASGQPRESDALRNDSLQDRRRGWKRRTKSPAAEKTNPLIFPADQFPATFHRFGDLPEEIRLYIWRLARPMRMTFPYESKPAHQAHCHQRCQACRVILWTTPVRAPAVMQACREARLETQRISIPILTWLGDSMLFQSLRPSWSRAQEEAAEKLFDIKERLPLITYFNAESDVIYLDNGSIELFSEKPGPPNHNDVFQVALDPEVPLVVDAFIFDDFVTPSESFGLMPNGIQALYHRYLKPRKHVYVDVGKIPPFVLTEEGWEKAIQEGLFSGHCVETRLVSINDVRLIKKYEALRNFCIPHTMASSEINWDDFLCRAGKPNHWHQRRLVKCNKTVDDATYDRWISNRLTASRENLSTAQLYMLQIADFIMWSRGAGDDRGEDIMDLDGQFKTYHPLVQQEDLIMPDYTAIFAFQAVTAPPNYFKGLYNRLQQMRPKYPEEDSSRLRLAFRRRCNMLWMWWRRFR